MPSLGFNVRDLAGHLASIVVDVVVQQQAGVLKRRPPGWNGGDPKLASSYPGYTPITLPANGVLNLTNGVDYFVTVDRRTWSSSSSRTFGIQILGGRNVVIVGGELLFTATNNLDDACAVLVDGGTDGGIVYLEGINAVCPNVITVRTRRRVWLQQSRFVVSAWNDDTNGGVGVHPDGVQVWGTSEGVGGHTPCAEIFMHRVTIYTTMQGCTNLVELSPPSGRQVDPLVWETWDVDIHPKVNLNGSRDAHHYIYHSSGPTGAAGGPYTEWKGEVYSELPTGGAGAYVRKIDDIMIDKGGNPPFFPYEIRDPSGNPLYTSPAQPTGGNSPTAVGTGAGNYLTFSRVPKLAGCKRFIGKPPASKGAVNGEWVPASAVGRGSTYVSPLYQ